MTSKLIDDGLAILDHLASRVSASALTGLGCGAAYATYKGFPIPKTSLSASLSCALVSTACFSMERLAFGVITRVTEQLNNEDNPESSAIKLTTPPNVVYASHALGGCFGGGIAGFLFQGHPFAGAFLLTPLMLCAGKMELKLEEYKTERLRQLVVKDDNE
ncbi:hypothetical protein QTG54_005950 [Skeletonema marinoi]|uniref:Uncharacterized protein n=1 Tax=Skeletonema marinoi TaxID=267567 RepID=A0AAD8YD09_9STRA|nr:hypothetical protein QTG54_005950 [Skeletonema marinoi]